MNILEKCIKELQPTTVSICYRAISLNEYNNYRGNFDEIDLSNVTPFGLMEQIFRRIKLTLNNYLSSYKLLQFRCRIKK